MARDAISKLLREHGGLDGLADELGQRDPSAWQHEPATNENLSMKRDNSVGWLAAAGLAGVIAGAVITGLFNHFDHANDLDAKMIELTAGILRSKPDPASMPLRDWAIDTLQKRAHFRFTFQQIATLKNQKLPFFDGYYDDGDDSGVGSKILPTPIPFSKLPKTP